MLNKINNYRDLKKLTEIEKKELAEDIRKEILDVVSKNGGHLASNLGIVDITIALLSNVDLNYDAIIWDVGHQSYAYKILTNRKERFKSLRTMNGISGFPRQNEDESDLFDTGHASTSISLALGLKRAKDLQKQKGKVVAVIGDGALTGGLALEALNDAGTSNTNIIVVLNDNTMSISKNTGGMSRFLSHLRTRKCYIKSNNRTKKLVLKIPFLGKGIYHLATSIKKHIKGLFIKNMYFENIGFTYLGPVDGHNIHNLETIIQDAANVQGPVLIHAITKKGQGYSKAMENPSLYHAVGKFSLSEGVLENKKIDYSFVAGNELVKMAGKHPNIVAITAAMMEGTGLTSFAQKYPKRFFDVAIAEEHAITLAAGLSKGGMVPFVAIYSTFLQRAYDEVIHDLAINKLHAILLIDRAGLTGNDGTTHQGILDLSYLNTIPGITIMAPSNYDELKKMMHFAYHHEGVIAIRYPKGCEENSRIVSNIIYGKSEVIEEGEDLTILACGKMTSRALEVSQILKKNNIHASIINLRFIKPLDTITINKYFKKTKLLVTMEDNSLNGGLASIITKYYDTNKVLSFGYPDAFILHGNIQELEKKYHLDSDNIAKEIKKFYEKQKS